MQIVRSDYTDRETFARARFPTMAHALRFVGDVVAECHDNRLSQVKIVNDRGPRASVTLIFAALATARESRPLHSDEKAQAALERLEAKWAT